MNRTSGSTALAPETPKFSDRSLADTTDRLCDVRDLLAAGQLPEPDVVGTVSSTATIFADHKEITSFALVAADNELRALRFVLDRSSDAFVGHDLLGRRIYTNDVYDRLTGYDGAEFVGKWGPFPEWDVAAEAAMGAGASLARSARRHGAEITTPLRITTRHPSGQTAAVNVYLHVVTDFADDPVAILAMVQPAHRVPWLERRSSADVERVRALESAMQVIAVELSRVGITPVADTDSVDNAAVEGLGQLSARQWEVIQHILGGRRVAAIATTMHLSEHTVRNHLKAIFVKLGVASQSELVERFRPVHASCPDRTVVR
jgi:DNA-binding NarL/FixJ family response regulator